MISAEKKNLFLHAKFHHLGLVVSSIDPDIEQTFDPVQKVTVAFIDIHGIKLELIKPESEDSPARNFVGKGIYHVCYEVTDIEKSVAYACQNGFKCIAEPTSAKAFEDKKIAWLISSKYGLVELLQK